MHCLCAYTDTAEVTLTLTKHCTHCLHDGTQSHCPAGPCGVRGRPHHPSRPVPPQISPMIPSHRPERSCPPVQAPVNETQLTRSADPSRFQTDQTTGGSPPRVPLAAFPGSDLICRHLLCQLRVGCKLGGCCGGSSGCAMHARVARRGRQTRGCLQSGRDRRRLQRPCARERHGASPRGALPLALLLRSFILPHQAVCIILLQQALWVEHARGKRRAPLLQHVCLDQLLQDIWVAVHSICTQRSNEAYIARGGRAPDRVQPVLHTGRAPARRRAVQLSWKAGQCVCPCFVLTALGAHGCFLWRWSHIVRSAEHIWLRLREIGSCIWDLHCTGGCLPWHGSVCIDLGRCF
mmetsp:Transcript_4240/g.7007  ORF Transcript_4240/g.7007 Transcript_4240/m.7007 type:complete len:349 (+) Transcript_4240:234-1280(+)